MATYLVRTEDDLFAIRNDIEGTYILQNDITLTKWQTGNGWISIPEFRGVIDGNGYAINDLYINTPDKGAGFIDFLFYGEVKNVSFKNVNILGGEQTGVIASRAEGRGVNDVDYYGKNRSYIAKKARIVDVKVNGVVRSSASKFGGLIGTITTTISPSQWDDDQMINVAIENTHVDLQMYAFSNMIGGFVGSADGGLEISASSTRGNIYNANQRVGGMIGSIPSHRGIIRNSYSLMTIQGSDFIGGLLGFQTVGARNTPLDTQQVYYAGTISVSGTNKSISAGVGYGYGVTEMLTDYQKLGWRNADAKMSRQIIEIRGVREYSTSEMANYITYFKHGFELYKTWIDDMTSDSDTLQLISEVDSTLTLLEGSGTLDDPYQIHNIYNLMAIEKYNGMNQVEYSNMLEDENNFSSPNYKPTLNFSPLRRYHYKLMADIDLNVFPFNQYGWISLCDFFVADPRRNDLTYYKNTYRVYNSEGEIVGTTTNGQDLNTNDKNPYYGNTTKGFIGVLDGNEHTIKNLFIKDWSKQNWFTRPRTGLFYVINGGTVKNLNLSDSRVDFDVENGYNLDSQSNKRPDKVVEVGILAGAIQGKSVIERVGIKGRVRLKDYASDVGNHGFVFGGLTASTTYGVNAFGEPVSNVTVDNSYVQLAITIHNVKDNYGGLAPLIYDGTFATVKNSYSASSVKIEFPEVGDFRNYDSGVFVRFPNVVLNSYYDSDIMGIASSSDERWIAGKVEINGRSTNAMKLQSTYTGWDFGRVWDSIGIEYPTFKPIDPNYIEPTNSITHIVVTSVDAPYSYSSSNGEHKKIAKVRVKSGFKRVGSKVTNSKRGTASFNTQLQQVYNVAFVYLKPNIGERTVTTDVIELHNEAIMSTKTKRTNQVLTSVDGFNSTVEAKGVNRGSYFGSIKIESFGLNSISVRINDKRIRELKFQTGIYPISLDRNYVNISVDPKTLTSGDNLLSIDAIDVNGIIQTSKKISIYKNSKSFRNRTSQKIIINGETYTILSHSSDGVMTLDRNLPTNISKINTDGQYNGMELVEYDAIPKLSIGERGQTPVFKEGTLIRTKRIDGMVEEEYEFIGTGNEVKTKIECSRTEQIFNLNGIVDWKYASMYYGYDNTFDLKTKGREFTNTELNLVKAQDGQLLSTTNIGGTIQDYFYYKRIEINILKLIRDLVDSRHDGSGIKGFKFKWVGKTFRISSGSGAGTRVPENNADVKFYLYSPSVGYKQVTATRLSSDSFEFEITENDIRNYARATGLSVLMVSKTSNVGNGWADRFAIDTDYIEYQLKVSNSGVELPLIKEIKQVFIPANQKTTI